MVYFISISNTVLKNFDCTGGSPLTATRYALVINKVVVFDGEISATAALCMLFASYYVLNLCYPAQAATTLEFLQRLVF